MSTIDIATELTEAWDAWEAHPRAATPRFRRDDALTAAARHRAGCDNTETVAATAAAIQNQVALLRLRRVPTGAAVAQVLARTRLGGPEP